MELGSEFAWNIEANPCKDTVFSYLNSFQTVYTDSGRSALRLLDMFLPRGAILLPAYICESVCACFPARELRFYAVSSGAQPDWTDLLQKLTPEVAVVYLHYFNGKLPDNKQLERLLRRKERGGVTIVEDTTHSIFSAPLTVGDYAVCSLRKWFPVPDGGVLYARTLADISPLPKTAAWVAEKAEAMRMKAEYLAGNGNEALNTAYREAFLACDAALEEQREIFGMSGLSRDILHRLSVSALVRRRQSNYRFLREHLCRFSFLSNFTELSEGECPLTYPILTRERDSLRAFLISRRVYCAVHWPLQGLPMEKFDAARISERELSLPVDQRYGEEELSYLIEQLERYGSERRC